MKEALEQELGVLALQRSDLQAAAEGLKSENEDLRGRAEALAHSAESLLEQKRTALQQVPGFSSAMLSLCWVHRAGHLNVQKESR